MNNGIEEDLRNQRNAICTWLALGIQVLSVNTVEEIYTLKGEFPEIKFIELERTGMKKYGKPVPYIFDMLEVLYENSITDEEICGIINSDIYLKNIEDTRIIENLFLENENRLVGLHRYDIEKSEDLDGQYYFSGIDVFFLKRKYLKSFCDEGFALGRPEWDHWMVYTAEKNDLIYTEIKNALAFHVKHKQRWKPSESNALGTTVQAQNNGEKYYCTTNQVLQDTARRMVLPCGGEVADCIWENFPELYVEPDMCEVADIEMKRHCTDAIRFPLGIGYYRDNRFYRVCALHTDAYWKKELLVNRVGAKQNEVPLVGEIMGYIDFMRTELPKKLGRFYLYSAGRAGKAMLDGLLYHGLRPLGFVDRDKNIQGTSYLDVPIFGLDVLEKKQEYDHVLLISNLYIDEIYRNLSKIVPGERLIMI